VFPQPLVITLAGGGHPAAASQPTNAAGANAAAAAAAAAAATATAAQSSTAAAAAATPDVQCSWPLLQLWQQYQQQGKVQQMRLPEVHLLLGPQLPWVASTDAYLTSNSSSELGLPELLLPDCSLLQQQAFLQQMPSLTVTYTHEVTAAEDDGIGAEQQQQRLQGGARRTSHHAQPAGLPATGLASRLLSAQATPTSFTLQPQDAGSSRGPFWVQASQQMASSSSSIGGKWHSLGPCAVTCPKLEDLAGAAVLGRQWLPHLLQLPQLKHLALPVVWEADGPQQTVRQARQLEELCSDLAAAAAACARAAAAAARHGIAASSSSSSSCAALEVLQLLLVPAVFNAPAGAAAPVQLATEYNWSLEALQQLLQALLLHLPRLQRLELSVMGIIKCHRDSLIELASSLGRQSSSLQSVSLQGLLIFTPVTRQRQCKCAQ
jgi:hypothetical protein